jgi:hypothetical protein
MHPGWKLWDPPPIKQFRMDFLSEGDSIEFIQNRLINALTNPVSLSTLGLHVLDIIQMRIDLIGMFIQRSTKLRFPMGQCPYGLTTTPLFPFEPFRKPFFADL